MPSGLDAACFLEDSPDTSRHVGLPNRREPVLNDDGGAWGGLYGSAAVPVRKGTAFSLLLLAPSNLPAFVVSLLVTCPRLLRGEFSRLASPSSLASLTVRGGYYSVHIPHNDPDRSSCAVGGAGLEETRKRGRGGSIPKPL